MEEKRNLHQIITLTNIIEILENNLQINETNFNQKINLYGIINYSRTQYFPELSSYITGNKEYSDIFFNYTSAESMILDLFSVIESDLVLILEETKEYDYNKMTELLNFSIKILKILHKIMNTKYEKSTDKLNDEEYQQLNTQYTNKLFNLQNEFYTLVYDEKIDSRIK
ncbi:MAG: hypothetical protein E7Z85_06680 [Methanosphaera stadtmanae]|nr:hypothetical protein [Methanosphaera stadtmanae]